MPVRRVILLGSIGNGKMSQKWFMPSGSFSIIGGVEVIAKIIISLGIEKVCKRYQPIIGILKE